MRKFESEAAMLAPATAAAHLLAGRPSDIALEVFYEISGSYNVADLVIVEWDDDAIAEREARGVEPLVRHASIATLLALAGGEPKTSAEIAARTYFSHGHTRGVLLPDLVERGFAIRNDLRHWRAAFAFRPIARQLTAIEAKRSDWGGAWSQAASYAHFADRTLVLLDAAYTGRVNPASFQGGIGLAVLDAANHETRIVHEPYYLPSEFGPLGPDPAYRALAAELAWSLRRLGANSGPVGHVFGKMLTCPDDPRRPAPAGWPLNEAA